MHKDLSNWYRSANIEPDPVALPKRWIAVLQFGADRDDIVILARFFYRLGNIQSSKLSTFVEALQVVDPIFKTRDNDHELAVLCGAKLVEVIEGGDTALADLAALCLVTAAAANCRPVPCVREIPEIAAAYLGNRSANRSSTDESNTSANSASLMLEALAALGKPYAELATEFRRLQTQVDLTAEESNILWWLFAEFSRDGKEPWKNFPLAAVALMSGKELADLVTVLPGPVAAWAFLHQVILRVDSDVNATISIQEAINYSPLERRQTFGECPSDIEDLMPISYGVKLSVVSPKDDAWVPAFKQGVGISPDVRIGPHLLANQFYLEKLLARSWKKLG
jgi:hypothetical protein